MEESLLIADASTLLNFLRVRRFDLMQGLGYRIRIVDAVFEEIQSEREHLEELVSDGHIKTLTLEGKAITDTVATLLGLGLGSGESFSFAAAIEFEARNRDFDVPVVFLWLAHFVERAEVDCLHFRRWTVWSLAWLRCARS